MINRARIDCLYSYYTRNLSMFFSPFAVNLRMCWVATGVRLVTERFLFSLFYTGCVIRVLQFLDKSLEHSEHTHHDFYAAELAGCLSRLAGHNTNKVVVSLTSSCCGRFAQWVDRKDLGLRQLNV